MSVSSESCSVQGKRILATMEERGALQAVILKKRLELMEHGRDLANMCKQKGAIDKNKYLSAVNALVQRKVKFPLEIALRISVIEAAHKFEALFDPKPFLTQSSGMRQKSMRWSRTLLKSFHLTLVQIPIRRTSIPVPHAFSTSCVRHWMHAGAALQNSLHASRRPLLMKMKSPSRSRTWHIAGQSPGLCFGAGGVGQQYGKGENDCC